MEAGAGQAVAIGLVGGRDLWIRRQDVDALRRQPIGHGEQATGDICRRGWDGPAREIGPATRQTDPGANEGEHAPTVVKGPVARTPAAAGSVGRPGAGLEHVAAGCVHRHRVPIAEASGRIEAAGDRLRPGPRPADGRRDHLSSPLKAAALAVFERPCRRRASRTRVAAATEYVRRATGFSTRSQAPM